MTSEKEIDEAIAEIIGAGSYLKDWRQFVASRPELAELVYELAKAFVVQVMEFTTVGGDDYHGTPALIPNAADEE